MRHGNSLNVTRRSRTLGDKMTNIKKLDQSRASQLDGSKVRINQSNWIIYQAHFQENPVHGIQPGIRYTRLS